MPWTDLGRHLFDLAEGGDAAQVMEFMTQHAEQLATFINWRNYSFTQCGETALIAAARKGHAEVARALLGGGADVHLMDWNRRSALSKARLRGQTAVVALLVAAGAVEQELLQTEPLVDLATQPHTQSVSDKLSPAASANGDASAANGAGPSDLSGKRGPKPTRTSLLRAGLHGSGGRPAASPVSVSVSAAPAGGAGVTEDPEAEAEAGPVADATGPADDAAGVPQQPAVQQPHVQVQVQVQVQVAKRVDSGIPLLLDPRFVCSARDLREQQAIAQDPVLRAYYLALRCGFHEAMTASAALACDVFALNPSTPSEVLAVASGLVSMPVASAALSAAARAADLLAARQLTVAYGRLRRLNPSADPVTESRLVEALARRATLQCQAQLLALRVQGKDLDKGKGEVQRDMLSVHRALLELVKEAWLLSTSSKAATPQSLASAHCQRMLRHIFSDGLQADPADMAATITELIALVAVPADQDQVEDHQDEAAPAPALATDTVCKPAKPPRRHPPLSPAPAGDDKDDMPLQQTPMPGTVSAAACCVVS